MPDARRGCGAASRACARGLARRAPAAVRRKQFCRSQELMPKTFVIIALVVACAGGVRATVLIPADLGELARDARAIARGRVIAVDAQWTDDRRTIETIVTLDVEAYLKGGLGREVRFSVP